MSKASEYAAAFKENAAIGLLPPKPPLRFIVPTVDQAFFTFRAKVTTDGKLMCDCYDPLSSEDALLLADWLKETFGE